MTKPAMRVVGRRIVEAEDLDGLRPEDVEIDDEGNVTVPDVLAAANEADRLQLEKRASAFSAKIAALTPSAYLLYLGLTEAVERHADVVNDRLNSRSPNLLASLRVPDSDWQESASAAWKAICAGLASKRLDVDPEAQHLTVTTMDRTSNEFEIGPLLRAAARRHTVAVYNAAAAMPPDVERHCDLVTDMSRPDPRLVGLTLARAFDVPAEPPIRWPDSVLIGSLDPREFDAVLERAPSPGAAIEIFLEMQKAFDAAALLKAKDEANKPASASATVRKATDVQVLHPTSPRVEDLHGYGQAASWAIALAQDIADYRAGALSWPDVDSGCLLHGPPGTGKTMLASAIAASAGVAFIPTSYADWQSRGSGYSGDVVRSIRATFDKANATTPCIVFIDEIDTVPARGSDNRHDDWWTMVTTALLEQLDGTNRREGIVVIGACNHPDRLDPALVRSGRLDRAFAIPFPDERALAGIFRHHLPGIGAETIEPVAVALAGTATGADVARIAREARREARRQKRDVAAEDLLRVAMPADTRSAAMRRLVAVHEAGHAVAMMVLGRVPDALSLVAGGGAHGGVVSDADLGLGRLVDIEDRVVSILAGRAAEEVVIGLPSGGASDDLRRATVLVSQLLGIFGLGGRLLYDQQVGSEQVEARLRDLYGRALRLVGEHRLVVERLADLALERRVLGRAALEAFAAEHLGGR